MTFLYIAALSILAFAGARITKHPRHWRTGVEMLVLAAIGGAVFYFSHSDWPQLMRFGAVAGIGLATIGGLMTWQDIADWSKERKQQRAAPIPKEPVNHDYTLPGYTKKPDDFNIV